MITPLIKKSLVRKSPVVNGLLVKGVSSGGWSNKPADWSDIRKDCPVNSIALYAGHKEDFSQYDNLAFLANCTGGYNVFIDGTQYGTTYANGATCSITWSTSGITTGDNITTPSALKAHKIWIEPATEGNNITAFTCRRVASSGTEQQGLLWIHFNITNSINLQYGISRLSTYEQRLCKAITAKNNVIKVNNMSGICANARSLEYTPIFDGENRNLSLNSSFYYNSALKNITLKNFNVNSMQASFYYCANFEQIKGSFSTALCSVFSDTFNSCNNLKSVDNINFSGATNIANGISYSTKLKDTIIYAQNTGLTILGIYGNSANFIAGLKRLRVSNEAPFTGTSPQINISYTGMDRTALTTLFNDLPYNVGYEVVGNPTINNGIASGFSVNDYLKLNNTSNSTSWEIYTEFIFDYYNGYQGLLSMASPHFQVFISSASTYTLSLEHKNNVVEPISSNQNMTSGHKYSLNIKQDNGHFQTRLYNMTKQELNLEKEFDGTSVSLSGLLRFGITQSGGSYWHGSQDIANTYIKINDVYFFRGTAAMTKTLSCVGATGTADLTQDDKDIALNKNWSLTLS